MLALRMLSSCKGGYLSHIFMSLHGYFTELSSIALKQK